AVPSFDETSLKTNMCKASGWAPRGERLVDHAPFGHWSTQTLIATLRHDRLDAPWVLSGPMNRVRFETYVGRRNPARRWRLVPVPAALQPRSQPHRDARSEERRVGKEV